MITYGTLYGPGGSQEAGYYEDRPREEHSFVLHRNPESGIVMLPRIFNVVKVRGSIQEMRAGGVVPQGSDTQPGDWVFHTPFGRYVLREYHIDKPDSA